VIGLAAACLLTAAPAAAQFSVEVAPLRVEMQAAPGGTTTQAITLTNAGASAVRIRARLTDWDLSRDGAPQFESAKVDGPFSATGWTRIAPPEQIIEAGKQAIVRFSLNVPAGTAAGGYRTGILFEFGPPGADPAAKGGQVMFKSRIATLLYVNVGQPPMAGDLVDLAIRPAGAQTLLVASLKNTSRRSVRTKGTVVIRDASGKVVREMPVPDVPLLPESERDVTIPLIGGDATQPLAAGDYRVELRIDIGLPEVLVGETALKVPR
jgi:P pilus assembly chaperone PapD